MAFDLVLSTAVTAIGPVLQWLSNSTVVQELCKGAVGAGGGALAGVAGDQLRSRVVAHFDAGQLPPNHDIARASRASLGNALVWMAHEIGKEPPACLRGDILQRLERGELAGEIELLGVPHAASRWLKGLIKLARDDRKLLLLDCRQLSGADVQQLLQTQTDDALAADLHQRVRAWLAEQLTGEGPPAGQLDRFLDEGWSLPGHSGHMTLYQAWCWFFRDRVKKSGLVFNSFVASALADLLAKPTPSPVAPADFATEFREQLMQQLTGLLHDIRDTTHRTLLAVQGLQRQVDALAGDLQLPDADAVPPWPRQREELNASQQALLALVTGPDPAPAVAPALARAVIETPIAGLLGYLLHRYAQACRHQGPEAWMNSGDIRFDTDFVALQLLVRPDADNDRTSEQRYDSLAELLAQPSEAKAWVLVGDAGGGKTTLLRHLETTHVRQVLTALAAGGDLPVAGLELCVWMRLSSYRREPVAGELRWPDCERWLEAQWAVQTGAAPGLSLQALRRQFKLRVLLDGINEIEPAADPALRQDAMRRFAEWVNRLRHQQLPPLFSVRRQDRGLVMLGHEDLTVRESEIVRWNRERIEHFCRRDEARFGGLWQALRTDASLLALCQVPFNLMAQCALYEQRYFAESRADLFVGMVWLKLQRGLKSGDIARPGLLSVLDRDLISSGSIWRGKHTRHSLPLEGGLLQGLQDQAREMAPRLQIAYDDAARFEAWPAERRMHWLTAVQSLGLVEVRTDDVGVVFAFAHQLWLEFFVARSLVHDRRETGADLLARPSIAQTPGPGGAGHLDGTSGPLDRMDREEVAALAVQLARQPGAFVEDLIGLDLALAGRAAAANLGRLDEQILARLRAGLLAASRDAASPVGLRIEAAEALGLMGDAIRYERRQGVDASQCAFLLPREAWGGPGGPGDNGRGWVRVAGGTYTLGTRDGQDEAEAGDLGPGGQPLQVVLAPFDIAFAPVTHAEYLLFVQDGGYEDECWWQGPAALQWRRGELRHESGRQWQWRRYTALVRDFDDAMQRYFFASTATNLEFARELASLNPAQMRAKLDSLYPYSGKPPVLLESADLANPLQPVVGVSAYEVDAYCRWLSARSGCAIGLPTEAQWDAAARGMSGRHWPWGDAVPGPDQLNHDALRLRRTSPVGVFPQGDTPDGCVDMAGNVWEWTSSAYTAEGLDAERVHAVAPGGALRTLRGGGHAFTVDNCRPGFRFPGDLLLRNKVVGFRLVRS